MLFADMLSLHLLFVKSSIFWVRVGTGLTDREYIIRAMNTKHAVECTCYTHSAGAIYMWVFLLQAARTIALCRFEHISDQVA